MKKESLKFNNYPYFSKLYISLQRYNFHIPSVITLNRNNKNINSCIFFYASLWLITEITENKNESNLLNWSAHITEVCMNIHIIFIKCEEISNKNFFFLIQIKNLKKCWKFKISTQFIHVIIIFNQICPEKVKMTLKVKIIYIQHDTGNNW